VILCVGLSPALDVTYRVPRLLPGRTNRVASVQTRPGGKAVNVSRVLAALGEHAHLVVPAGGPTGAELDRRLTEAGIPATIVPDRQETRRTVTTVTDDGTATVLTEPASTEAWPELRRVAAELLPSARVLVLSGAVPAGAPPDALADLVQLATARGVPSVVDTSGEPMRAALAGGPTLVKPNADELAELGHDSDPVAAVQLLAGTYDVGVVASLGADGVAAAAAGRSWTARPAEVLVGNPTGAGDALVAGLARFLAGRSAGPLHDLGDALPDGVALAAAAVHRPHAGEIDLATHREHRDRVVVREGVAR
jgi:tagatose 6-phosphate kinase